MTKLYKTFLLNFRQGFATKSKVFVFYKLYNTITIYSRRKIFIYNENNTGPKKDHWGTPNLRIIPFDKISDAKPYFPCMI